MKGIRESNSKEMLQIYPFPEKRKTYSKHKQKLDNNANETHSQ